MNKVYKVIIGLTMSVALLFGFLHTVWPEVVLSFEWLHIFLFNLLGGGALIIYYTEGSSAITGKVKLYFFLSIIYTFSAAAKIYPVTLVISIPLFLVVEWVRIKHFSLFPFC
ncbi:MAG: hypothetical protein GY762_21320, partial [Proteobacteria bacterium]|nr:hypothetical protein [Pseudomonadota bacterium]